MSTIILSGTKSRNIKRVLYNLRPIQNNAIRLCNLLLHKLEGLSEMSKFRQDLKTAREVVVLTGASISTESGLPTFHGDSSLWRGYDSTILATDAAFRDDPGIVWEFFHYRRELVMKVEPNASHLAIAQYEAKHASDKKVAVVTQNIDGLHAKAGSKNIIELHGNVFKTLCTKCNEVLVNTDSPICEALRGHGSPDSKKMYSDIKENDLPHCKKCGGLLRPHVVWASDRLDYSFVKRLDPILANCKVLLVVDTPSLVHPADVFPSVVAAGGASVAEFNTEPAPATLKFDYYFMGPSAKTLPEALLE